MPPQQIPELIYLRQWWKQRTKGDDEDDDEKDDLISESTIKDSSPFTSYFKQEDNNIDNGKETDIS